MGLETFNIYALCTLIIFLKQLCYQYSQDGLTFTNF